jgi:putative holliday junction resolvase
VFYSLTESVWIGIDPGTARCGVAASDASLTLASPLAVVPTEPRTTLGSRILTALQGRTVAGLVVGLPLDQRGGEGPAALLARELGALVETELGCTAVYVDERFSTRTMATGRTAAGRSGRQQRSEIDAWAAAAILQSHLDRLKAKG